ncbi:MAG: 4-alpha-glucanotransferase [Alphaproteobacteria bacterium]|nr:4-alpha-glucanotransferase [Alphaproteobacteria bacterium]
MNDRSPLREMARLIGVETRFTDALGETRQVSDDTLRALIAAFGLPPEPVRARRELEERQQTVPLGLEATQIIGAEDIRPQIVLRPPQGCRRVGWTCHLEDGNERRGHSPVDSQASDEHLAIHLPGDLPLGYHRLAIEAGSVTAQTGLIVAPDRCHLPAALGPGARSWGLSCQLYGLRSERNWGMGDFTDLTTLTRAAGYRGASVVGINPLHALFASEPLHVSPYSPSSRSELNYLYIDVTGVSGFAEDERVQSLMRTQWFGATHWAARSAELIDYGAVAGCKRRLLEALFCRFQSSELGPDGSAKGVLGRAFREFQSHRGQALADFAVFEALHEYYFGKQRLFAWRNWPVPMRNPRSPEVAEFAAAHRDRVEFFEFLQWEADRQLAAAARAGRESGLSIGLYRDLAVGADPNGAEAWADQELVAPSASIGAPPDALSRVGQNWGLAPVNPLVLRRQGFASFIASLRANMRHAGILRVDHVMSLNRLFWIPSGMQARSGTYVNYPFDDLVRLVALESQRHACAVVGEDLGTVPEGFRAVMRSANILSFRIFAFERRDDGGLVPPVEYPPLAAAAAATHDIATLKGFWLGADMDWRRRLGLYPDPHAEEAEAADRRRDRRLLLAALVSEGLLDRQRIPEFLPESGAPVYSRQLGEAIHAYLGRSRARLMLLQLEDLICETEQANLPGTTDAHPNWRRRLSRTLEEIIDGEELRRTAGLIEQARRRAAPE